MSWMGRWAEKYKSIYANSYWYILYILFRGSGVFIESNVQRSSTSTPSDGGDNSILYSFYVKYPGVDTPITSYILASVVKIKLDAMQLESSLSFSLQTPFKPPIPTIPTADQSRNVVELRITGKQADQVYLTKKNDLSSYCMHSTSNCYWMYSI